VGKDESGEPAQARASSILLLGRPAASDDAEALAAAGVTALDDPERLTCRAVEAGRCVVLLPVAALAGRGWATLVRLRQRAPAAAVCLLARGDQTEQALALARAHDIGVILPEGGWRWPLEWQRWMRWIARPDGADFLATYLGEDAPVETLCLRRQSDRERADERFFQMTDEPAFRAEQRYDALLALEELLNNAVLHAFSDHDEPMSGARLNRLALAENEWIETRIGSRGNRLAFSVADNGGRLTCRTVLDRLHLHCSRQGLGDLSGRGLFLVYRVATRLLVRVARGRRTEICALLLKDPLGEDAELNALEPRPLLVLEEPSEADFTGG
jgi:anti-sigma regulatory factor (Ser/Thr protein kinase)